MPQFAGILGRLGHAAHGFGDFRMIELTGDAAQDGEVGRTQEEHIDAFDLGDRLGERQGSQGPRSGSR